MTPTDETQEVADQLLLSLMSETDEPQYIVSGSGLGWFWDPSRNQMIMINRGTEISFVSEYDKDKSLVSTQSGYFIISNDEILEIGYNQRTYTLKSIDSVVPDIKEEKSVSFVREENGLFSKIEKTFLRNRKTNEVKLFSENKSEPVYRITLEDDFEHEVKFQGIDGSDQAVRFKRAEFSDDTQMSVKSNKITPGANSNDAINVCDIVKINSDPSDKLFSKIGLIIEEVGCLPGDEWVEINDTDERYFNVLIEGRCYMYGDFEIIKIPHDL